MPIRDRWPAAAPRKLDPANFEEDKTVICAPLEGEEEDRCYVRIGGCTRGCGACCLAVVVPLDDGICEEQELGPMAATALPLDPHIREKHDFADFEHWLQLHDIHLLEDRGLWAPVPSRISPAEHPDSMSFEEFLAWWEDQGVTFVRQFGRLLAFLPQCCTALNDDGLCVIHEEPDFPQTCARCPRHPTDIIGLEHICTYHFAPLDAKTLRATIEQVREKPGKRRGRGRG